jgi:hypothetical protein
MLLESISGVDQAMRLSDTDKAALFDCLRPEVRRMANRMEQKFRLHDTTRGNPFQPLSFEFLDERYTAEWDELMLALGDAFRMDCDAPIDGKKPSDVWNEAADCCNFILMMCVNYERQWTEMEKCQKK